MAGDEKGRHTGCRASDGVGRRLQPRPRRGRQPRWRWHMASLALRASATEMPRATIPETKCARHAWEHIGSASTCEPHWRLRSRPRTSVSAAHAKGARLRDHAHRVPGRGVRWQTRRRTWSMYSLCRATRLARFINLSALGRPVRVCSAHHALELCAGHRETSTVLLVAAAVSKASALQLVEQTLRERGIMGSVTT